MIMSEICSHELVRDEVEYRYKGRSYCEDCYKTIKAANGCPMMSSQYNTNSESVVGRGAFFYIGVITLHDNNVSLLDKPPEPLHSNWGQSIGYR
jgi:hypothetical protein